MDKRSIALLSTLMLTALVPLARGQDGVAERAGQALDNAGKNIRRGVENAVTRGQIAAQERDLLGRVYSRVHWDKALAASTIEIEARADGAVILRGAVADQAAKDRAVDLVQSTVGVTTVVDETVVGKEVKVIEATPAGKRARVIEADPPVVVAPKGAKVIVKP